jgi:Mor family transcriptional regulator
MEVKWRNKKLSITDQVSIVTDYNAGMLIAEMVKKWEIPSRSIYRILRKQVS